MKGEGKIPRDWNYHRIIELKARVARRDWEIQDLRDKIFELDCSTLGCLGFCQVCKLQEYIASRYNT